MLLVLVLIVGLVSVMAWRPGRGDSGVKKTPNESGENGSKASEGFTILGGLLLLGALFVALTAALGI